MIRKVNLFTVIGDCDYKSNPDKLYAYKYFLKVYELTLKAPITTAADDIHKYFSLFFRENRT